MQKDHWNGTIRKQLFSLNIFRFTLLYFSARLLVFIDRKTLTEWQKLSTCSSLNEHICRFFSSEVLNCEFLNLLLYAYTYAQADFHFLNSVIKDTYIWHICSKVTLLFRNRTFYANILRNYPKYNAQQSKSVMVNSNETRQLNVC